MFHPEIVNAMTNLSTEWTRCMNLARAICTSKTEERAPQYDQNTPVWMRLTRPEQFATLLMVKAERVCSELSGKTDLTDFDPDNAVDLIVYTTFLVAYHLFVKKGEENDSAKPNNTDT